MTRIPFTELPDAGLWRRLAAGIYDGLLLLGLWFILGFVLAIIETSMAPQDVSGPIRPLLPAAVAQWVVPPVLWLIAAAFYGWFWQHGGQTLGMRSWRLRLVTTDNRALTWRDCLLRSGAGTLSLLAGLAGYLWLLVDRNGRTFHDRVSATRVLLLPKDAA